MAEEAECMADLSEDDLIVSTIFKLLIENYSFGRGGSIAEYVIVDNRKGLS
jgi:hypothetical protein